MEHAKITEETAKNGDMTYALEKEGRKAYIYSKYNPGADIEKRVNGIDFTGAGRIIIFGAGIKEGKMILESGFEGELLIVDSVENIEAAKEYIDKRITCFEIEKIKELIEEIEIKPKISQKIIKVMPLVLLNKAKFDAAENWIEKIISDSKEIPDEFYKNFNCGISKTFENVKAKEAYQGFDYTIAAAIEMITNVTRRECKYEF